MILLGCMDLDLALKVPKLDAITATSSESDMAYMGTWERSSRLSLMIIRRGIPKAFRSAVPDEDTTAKDYLAAIEQRFVKNDKAETSVLLAKLIAMRYSEKGNIRDYIMEMSNLASKLKSLKLELSGDLLVHLVLISLPGHYNQFKISYNCQKEKWSLNELISFCVQEEERLKQDMTESAHLIRIAKDKGKKKVEDYRAAASEGPSFKKMQVTCYFYENSKHVKKDCPKYADWRAKKGLPELSNTK